MTIRSVIIPLFIFLFISTVVSAQKRDDVRIINDPSKPYIELRNGLMGVVIPKESTYNSPTPEKTLAPIQSVIYRDGTYSDNTPNYFQGVYGNKPYPTRMKVTILKQSPEESVVSVLYNFQKPAFGPPGMYKDDKPGEGYYQSTIKLSRGSKSAIIDEESDFDFFWEVKISIGLQANKARYRGHSANSKEFGYEPSGAVYQAGNKKVGLDATIDLDYSQPRQYGLLSFWDPGGGEQNTGRYWQTFNSEAGPSANIIGFFQGKPSKLVGAAWVGAQLTTDVKDGLSSSREKIESIRILFQRRGPDNVWFPRKKFQWGLFVSTMNDLLPADQMQGIGREMNVKSGLAEKMNDYLTRKAILIPAFFDGALFMNSSKVQEVIRKIKSDETFYRYVCNVDPYFKPVADVWRKPDSAATMKSVRWYRNYLMENFINQDGIHTHEVRYWMGARFMKLAAVQISAVVADKSFALNTSQKNEIIQLMALMARIIWDEDYVPFSENTGLNYGPENMYYMFKNNGRDFFAMLFANDPEFKERAKKIVDGTRKDILNGIAGDGAAYGTPHYIQAGIDPILYSMLQLKQAGVADLFKEQQGRLKAFIDFYSNLLTPPSVRFNDNRKLVAFGDGSEESAVTFALLAAGFQDIDKKLAADLMGIFQHGTPRLSIFGSIAMTFDLVANYDLTFKPGNSNYPGYLAHMRSGGNSNNETALWFLTGEHYKDHRHDDRGQVAIYALKAPLSLSSSSMYEPRADDARLKSVVVPETIFPEWNKANQPVNMAGSKGNPWASSQQKEYADVGKAVTSTAVMKNKNNSWSRTVSMISVEEKRPVIFFFDEMKGNESFIWSMPFMSQGAIKTPAGNITPADKMWDARNANKRELPQATNEQNLSKGLNVFSFTGQTWPQATHPSGGIDWKLYSLSSSNNSFTISQWTNNWQNNVEQQEYQQTMGRPYSETQQILRIKSQQPFFNVIVPYAKGTEPAKVKQVGDNRLQLQWDDAIMEITPTSYAYTNDAKTIAAALSDTDVKEKNISIAGGPAEVEWIGKKILIRVHGNSGRRRIVVPARVNPDGKNKAIKLNMEGNNTVITIPYDNKNAAKLSTEKGYTEFSFSIR